MKRARAGTGFSAIRFVGETVANGAAWLSVMAAPKACGLVVQAFTRCELLSHSFPFFTGLCEKSSAEAASLAPLAGRHK